MARPVTVVDPERVQEIEGRRREIGRRIKFARELRGRGRGTFGRELTAATGVLWPESRVGYLERGEIKIDAELLAVIAELLDMGLDFLVLGRAPGDAITTRYLESQGQAIADQPEILADGELAAVA